MADPMEVAAGAGALGPGGAIVTAASALNKSMGVEAMAKVTNSANELVASAKSGGFTVTKEAADPIIKTLDEFIDRVGALKSDLSVFDQAPPLGDHAYGKMVSRHMYQAANDDQSARAAVNSLQVVLEKSKEALLRASSQYEEQEQSARDVLEGMGD
ncbi:hypothetical protein [Saccharomonospora piscinae]|uniref:hypothetical protein n=1 Tax=Saccharomonospora piscinae TaxID=687388 RepID=UPI001FD98994|nr:hypothetical protein [Saccharomonospora piscinae]